MANLLDHLTQTPETLPGKDSGKWQLSGQIEEGQPSRNFDINSSEFFVGRSSECGLPIAASYLSKKHAQFKLTDDDRLFVSDLNSTNGTFVNGERVSDDVEVFNGDIVQIATVLFRVNKVQDRHQENTVEHNVCDKALALAQFERLIEDGGLYPHYQPIVDLQFEDTPAIGYEVLGRSRVFGLQQPAEMFAAAMQLDCEAELSEKMRLAGVTEGMEKFVNSNLFVNTHPKELDSYEFYSSLHALRASAPEQILTLEIHEAAVTNLKMMRELQAILKDLDIKLAFDDFGVGQARLVELGEIRPDFVKFDMKLTKAIDKATPKRQELVSLFAKLIKNLGIQTLAEGVETIECHNTLVSMGFELGQGFYYGKPLPLSNYKTGEF